MTESRCIIAWEWGKGFRGRRGQIYTDWDTRKIGGDGYIYYLDYNDDFKGVNVETILMVHFP